MSGKVLWIVFAAIVVSLALWLALVLLADRNYYRRAHREVSRGPAQDDRHAGDPAGRPGSGSGNPHDP